MRRVFRFGQKIHGDDLICVPPRYREGPGEPSGRLDEVRLRPQTSEVWLRLRQGEAPFRRTIRTVPLNATQPPAPTPESLSLHGGLSVYCHDGAVGKLEGLAIDAREGVAIDLLVHIRGNVLADVELTSDPMNALVPLSGQRALLAPAWAISTTQRTSRNPLQSSEEVLLLDVSVEQIASATVLRPDGDLAGDIWLILNGNPALAPSTGHMQVLVHDGDVTLRGVVPSPRHRASAEQDVWHIAGVLAVHNELTIGG